MASGKLYNLARMTTATAGTGTISLGAAVAGHLTFAQSGVSNGETVSYGIRDGSNSEVGTGVYTTAGLTLTRSVLKSTNGNALISLSGGAAEVFIDALATNFSEWNATHAANGFSIGFNDNTGIADDSGNETVRFRKTTSAVNYIDVLNTATGVGPQISAKGDDTNIDLQLAGKGTGVVTAPGLTLASAVAGNPQALVSNTAADATGGYVIFDKKRTAAASQVGDTIGNLLFRAMDSGPTQVRNAAFITSAVTAVAATTVDANLQFYTYKTGAGSLRLTLTDTDLFTGTNVSHKYTLGGSPAAPAAGFIKSYAQTIDSTDGLYFQDTNARRCRLDVWDVYPSNATGLDTIVPSVRYSSSNNVALTIGGGGGGYHSISGHNTVGYQALMGYSETLGTTGVLPTNESCAGVYAVADNNYLGTPGAGFGAYGIYAEARTTTGLCLNEFDGQNCTGADCKVNDPNNIFGTGAGILCANIWLATGGSKVPYGANDISFAIGITNSYATARHKKGIVFNADCIATVGGHKEAIALGQDHQITWYSTGGTVGRLSSTGTALTWSGTSYSPTANDGAALGTTALNWADLFLASGSVVNWNNGDITLTHSANKLTFAGASTGYQFDSYISIGRAPSGTEFDAISTAAYGPQQRLTNNAADTTAGYFLFQKQRAGAGAQVGDDTGNFSFQAMDSGATSQRNAAAIVSSVTAVAATTVDANLKFVTYVAGVYGLKLTIGGASLLVGPSTELDLAAGTATIPPLKFASGTNLTTAVAGALEYDGKAFYSSTVANTRGVSPSVLFSTNTSDFVGTNVNTAQPVFDTAQDVLTVPASTSYMFEAVYHITRAAGVTSHTTAVLFGGTATFTSINYLAESTTTTGNVLGAMSAIRADAATAVVVTAASTSATENIMVKLTGMMRVNGAGTVIPQIIYSAAPGGTPTFVKNSFITLYPVGTNTVVSVGNWA